MFLLKLKGIKALLQLPHFGSLGASFLFGAALLALIFDLRTLNNTDEFVEIDNSVVDATMEIIDTLLETVQ